MNAVEIESINDIQLVLITSVWVKPLDDIIWTSILSIYSKLHVKNQLKIQIINQKWQDERYNYHKNITKYPMEEITLESSAFIEMCKVYNITTLPHCILIDNMNTPIDLTKWATNHLPLEPLVSFLYTFQTTWIDRLNDVMLLEKKDGYQPTDEIPTTLRENANEAFENGQYLQAIHAFLNVLQICPTCTKSMFNIAVILQTLGEIYFATVFMLQVVAINDTDAVAHTILRSVCFTAEPELVIEGYKAIIARSPSNVRASHSLATLTANLKTDTASLLYVRDVFDDLASTFEEKLVTHLDYKVPELLLDALVKLEPIWFSSQTTEITRPTREYSILDLGCGTGLCGKIFRPFATYIAGVDVSSLMIEQARSANVYDYLETNDIVSYLQKAPTASFDVILSADVWIYVGNLSDIFPLCASRTKLNGYLVFSIETWIADDSKSMEQGFQLARSGRFQHTIEYIEILANRSHYYIRSRSEISVRKESGESIPGWVFVLQYVDS